MSRDMDFKERIPGNDYAREVYLNATAEGLEITVDDTENETTIVLSDYGVRELRLALARYERLASRVKPADDLGR